MAHSPLLTPLIYLIRALPLSLLQGFARNIARLLITLNRQKQLKTVRLNLAIAFPHLSKTERETLSELAYQNELQSYAEFIKIWANPTHKNIDLIHCVTGKELLEHALNEQKGVVLVVPHFGTWEVMNPWVSQFTPMSIMYKPFKNPYIDQFVRDARSREQAILATSDEQGVKQVFKALKQGGITAILPDHNPQIENEMNTWFDIPLYSSQLVAKLIQKTQATPLMLYAIRNKQAGFDMFIEALPAQLHSNKHNGMEILYQSIEKLIEKYPSHYHWHYRRFHTNPQLRDIYRQDFEQALAQVQQVREQHQTQ
ncbi:MAG: hypothetical protein Q4B82_03720 [Alysiella sp.]|uniref:lysophospholipid acyltransferase family protein n=1 Tax=Alysiella sp. TaxID=1872483 RepID=UPI0026DCF471|nr:hypothetical protein [Alysiella sp.]MDO4433672.1 hypothetical protein [Alysiella sp.]